jgi:hypothetical protein
MPNLKDRRMQQIAGTAGALLKDRRVQLISGAAIALLAGLALAISVALRPDADAGSPPASEGGLVVQTGHETIQKLDPAQLLKCYVGGRLAGEMTVAGCARKNGVATGALDVGVTPSGGLAASAAPSNLTIPPPPPPPSEADAASSDEAMTSADEDTAGAAVARPCYAHDGGRWSRTPGVATLGACVQTLFAGQCEAPGAAVYGRWGNKSLRLVLGKVEISDDGGNFRTLVVQTGACAIPDLG